MQGLSSGESLTLGTQGLLLVFSAILCLTGAQAGQEEGRKGPLRSTASLFCQESTAFLAALGEQTGGREGEGQPGSHCQTLSGWAPVLPNKSGPLGKKRPLEVSFSFRPLR